MKMRLIVVRPFGGLNLGDVITNPARITCILTGDYAHSVARMVTRMAGEAK